MQVPEYLVSRQEQWEREAERRKAEAPDPSCPPRDEAHAGGGQAPDAQAAAGKRVELPVPAEQVPVGGADAPTPAPRGRAAQQAQRDRRSEGHIQPGQG
ncbi:unnamed protein product, partial [Hapterophycus canaliculatus]